MEIREYCESNWDGVWSILKPVFEAGDTFPNPTESSEQEAWEYWIRKPKYTIVALRGRDVVGSYHMKDNQIGLGSHVANAGYVVHPKHKGNGIGYALGKHSISFAIANGYSALQFNLVVSTNSASIALWKKLEFEIVGKLPKAFNHKQNGLVDAYVMYRRLV